MGIRFKLFLPLLLGFIVFYIVLTQYFTPLFLEHERKQFIIQQEHLIESISPAVTQEILLGDIAALFENLDRSMDINKGRWISLTVRDINNNKLFPLDDLENTIPDDAIYIDRHLLLDNENFGVISVISDWGIELQNKKRIADIVTNSTLLLFGFITIASLIWQNIWVRIPIQRLNTAALKLQNDDFDSPLPKSGNDEIGVLTSTFEEMRSTIKSSRITLNKALKDSKEKEYRNHIILSTTPDPIITINKSGDINTFNEGAERTFKYTSDEVSGNNIDKLLDSYSSKLLFQHINSNKEHNHPMTLGLETELFGVNKNKKKFPVEISINNMSINDTDYFTLVVRDISERKKIDELKSDFISTVSHELRTPLTAITGSIGLLNHTIHSSLDSNGVKMLDIAERNVERLLLLVNDILDISKLESGKMEFSLSPLNVVDVVEQAICMNQAYAEAHNTRFILTNSISEDAKVYTDKNRLIQVLSNLMSNAAKFSPNNQPVELSIQHHNSSITINVRDHGPGIPDEFKSRLFEKFTQAKSGNTRNVGGTGLGLNICKTMIERLGGKIGFQTKEGEGTVFFIVLPVYNE